MRQPSIHNLRHNRIERSPARLITFDTETRWTTTPTTEVHTLRLWVARHRQRLTVNGSMIRPTDAAGTTAAELAAQVDRWCTPERTTWIFAHNLAFDLTVTRLPLELMARGWQLGQHALTLDSPWLRMKHGRRRLTMVDSYSYLSRSLEALGRELGVRKVQLPDNDDSDEAWLQRCAGDVVITEAAILELLDWWDENRLGCWSLTGASTGWNAYRHHPNPVVTTVDPDPEARAFERATVLAGRREVWRVGALPPSRYCELDLERAHLTAARCFDLPIRRSRHFSALALDDHLWDAPHWSMLADCTVRTSEPRYPLHEGGRVWYPVGEFRTRLCGPELHEARSRGELISVGSGYVYRLGRSMGRWATWLEALLCGEVVGTPPMALVAAKSWSRRVPGKWATRTSRTLSECGSWDRGWHLERGMHHPSGKPVTLLHLGGREYTVLHDQDADDSFPAVLAWIQSITRLALNRLVDHFGAERMVSCNTDGLIVRSRRRLDLEALSAVTAPFTVRQKGVHRDVEVLSPQHLILDGQRRLSGIPASAPDEGRLRFAWRTWPGFARQLELGAADGFTRERRSVELVAVPVNRWVLEDGSCMPVHAAVRAAVTPQLLTSASGPWWPADARLAPSQHPWLERLMREPQDRASVA